VVVFQLADTACLLVRIGDSVLKSPDASVGQDRREAACQARWSATQKADREALDKLRAKRVGASVVRN